jgi:hypothetical protein
MTMSRLFCSLTVLTAIATLVACATPSDIARPIRELKGKPASEVVTALGVPHQEEVILGSRVLRYKYSETGTYGAVAPAIDPAGNAVAVPYTQVRKWYCDIDLVLDEKLVVTDVQLRANSVYYCPRVKGR